MENKNKASYIQNISVETGPKTKAQHMFVIVQG